MLASDRSSPPNQIGRPPQKVADHDPIVITLADRNLVDPDDQGTRRARACELCLHVLHLQRLDGVQVKRQFLRNIRDRRLSATAADKIGKALGVKRVVCQKVEPFPFHLAAATAIDAPHLQLKQDSHVPAGQVTHLPDFAVVPPHLDTATASTRCFFERRFKVTIRTFGSPKTPRTTGSARKPSNEYVSQSRRRRFDVLAIRHLCQILNPAKMQNIPEIPRVMAFQAVKFTHSIPRRSNKQEAAERLEPTPTTVAPPSPSASAEIAGERRYLTVMFCDLVGSTGISARLDAEEWRDLVRSYLDAASEAVTEMGGHVAKKLGD